MMTLPAEQREALFAKLQAIPDGALVEVRATHPLLQAGMGPFVTTGTLYTTESGQRYVADTNLTYEFDGEWTISPRIRSVKRIVAGSATADLLQSAIDAGMVPR